MNTTDENVTVNPKSESYHYSVAQIAYVCGMSINSILMIVFNATCLLVLRRTSEINYFTKIFMTSLTIADFFLGWLLIPMIITIVAKTNHFVTPLQHTACLIHATFYMMVLSAGLMSLLAVTFDRYLHVSRPLRYNLIMTKTKACFIVLTCWIWPLLATVAYITTYSEALVFNKRSGYCFMDARDQSTAFVILYTFSFAVIPLSVVIILYIKMLFIAKEHATRMQRRVIHSGQSNNISSTRMIPHARALKTFLLITLGIGVTHTPISVIYFYENFSSYANVEVHIVYACLVTMFLNHWFNCVVYYFQTTWFKTKFRTLFCR